MGEPLTPRGVQQQGDKEDRLEMAGSAFELRTSRRTVGDPRRWGWSLRPFCSSGCLHLSPVEWVPG